MENTIKNLQSSNLYSKEELERLERNAKLFRDMEKRKLEKRLRIGKWISYSVLISILGLLSYMAFFVLEIGTILIIR
jgi:hypothetical protein